MFETKGGACHLAPALRRVLISAGFQPRAVIFIMADQYARAAAKVATAQLAEAAGFEAVDRSSLEVLSELLLRYINEIGAASHSYAESAGRTDSNALDVVGAGRAGHPARSFCSSLRSFFTGH